MNTNLTVQNTGGWSTQAEVFDKAGIFAEIRLDAEHVHNDFANTGGNLVARPAR
jgi:hypothetical protein